MFIQPVSYEVAADFVQAFENVDKEPVRAGGTLFLPCRTAANQDLYVMFDPLGDAAIIGKGEMPTLET